ncbi:MAG: ATP-binding protein [Campylobacteraceae bacterium]
MLRLHQHVSRQLIIMIIVSICVVGASSYFVLKYIELNNYENSLKSVIQTVKMTISQEDDFVSYAKDFQNITNIRMSIMDDNGEVIADSNKNGNLENHNNRAEVIEARSSDYGTALRYSNTLDTDFLYVASMFYKDGKPYFVRLSMDTESIMKSFYMIWANVTFIFTLVLLAGLYWASIFNKKIRVEVAKLSNAFGAIANKEYKSDYNFGFAREFVEIGIYLKKLSKRLDKKEKQKRKYTAQIKLISKQKSDIISAISHEFKNPIAAILGYAQTLNDDPNLSADIRKKFLEKIVKNGEKISNMIDRLSLATKFESGDLSPNIKEFDFNETVKEIIGSFNTTNPDRVINYDGEKYLIKADEQMLELVIANLIQNAIKYSELEINISLKDGVFSVKDFGIGIAPDEIEKVTQKFYRSNTKTWDNSMGLGLAFATYILKLHNTKLEIQSVLNEGSTFSFKIV